MKRNIRVFFFFVLLTVLILSQIAFGKTYAYDITFSGITASIDVNVRSAPSLNAQALYQIPPNTKMNFDGWVYGDSVNDYWTGKPDSRWFFFFNDRQERLYVASAMVNGNPPAVPGDATVPEVQQEKSNWCWAGVSQAILAHYNINVTQTQIAFFVKGGIINEPASNYDIVRGLRHFNLNATSFDGVPSYGTIQNQINNGNPMINLISWRSGGGHFHVLDGYFSNEERSYIKVMDPWYGDHYDYDYNYYKSNSNFWWNLYIDSFSKK